MEGDAGEFIINAPWKAPAFMLVKEGFDVWMGNNRGSKYGQEHISLDPNEKEFWDFDFEEMGMKDLPAMIDLVLKETGQSKLSFLGHSMGTTQMLIGLSMIPEYYKDKINLFVAMGPVARLLNCNSEFFRKAAEALLLVKNIVIDVFHNYNFYKPDLIQ